MRLNRSAVLLSLLLAAGCAGPSATVGQNPYPPPPALRAEAIPKPPVTEQLLVWQPGHWDWTGNGYAWQEGRYVPLAGHGTQWMFGYWTNSSGNWTWVPAHWM